MAKDNITYPSLITLGKTFQSNINTDIVDKSAITDQLVFDSLIGIEDVAPPPVNPNLIGYWPFLGNANDIIGGNNGIVNGATLVNDRHGNPNSAYNYVGTSSQYIEIGDVLDMGLNDWSISTRVNISSLGGVRGIVSKSALSGISGRYGLTLSEALLVGIFQGAGAVVVSTAITIGSKYLTLTFDRSGNMSVYIDTVFQNSTDISTASAVDLNSAIKLRFGCYNDGAGDPDNYFTGTQDFVKIYDKVIDAAEMAIDLAL